MEKFRNFKNRLSVSVDKLSPHRRAVSPLPSNRKSVGPDSARDEISISTSADPMAEAMPSPDVPLRRNRNRSARPVSMDESDVEDSLSGQSAPRPKAAVKTKPSAAAAAAATEGTNSKLDPGTESLVLEVMKEVEKIGSIADGINRKTRELENSTSDKANSVKKLEENLEFIDSAEEEESTKSSSTMKDNRSVTEDRDASEMSLQSTVSEKQLSTKDTCLSVSSTLHAESMTSGYFTDSAPEISTVSKPKPAATVFSTLSNIEGKPPPKKESIYSKLLKKKEKEKEETQPKEPLYARIKPKLKVDTGFKPIDPGLSEGATQSSPVIKPEPIYSKVKPRIAGSPATPSTPASPIYSGSPRSSFVPLSPSGEPIYSKITPKSSTLPIATPATETMDTGAKTLPKDIPMFSPRAKYPIYNQPLPALPVSQDDEMKGRQVKPVPEAYRATVTVREKEISPVRANVITINNSTFVPSPPLSPKILHSTFSSGSSSTLTKTVSASTSSSFGPTPPVSPQRIPRASRLTSSNASIENSNRKSQDFSVLPPPKAPKSTKEKRRNSCDRTTESSLASRETITTDSCLSLGSNPVETSGRVLSKLVEELSVELEAVSRRLGNQVCSDDDAKKEVLSKLLATYDVPKNLRRVAEVDEEEVLRSERFMVPVSSSDELRLVGESDDHVDMFYADIPDYSHDEFVIALDDENDPKYATLTNEMRQRQSRSLVDMSPGKVSRRSAQVYLNVVNVLSALKILVNSNSARAAGVITRMGTLARPYAKKVQSSVQTSVQDTSWIQRRIYHVSGHNGFDELRRYIKGGGEFCKELAVILQERAELESAYAKGLHKLAGKLVKASRDSLGSVHQAWQAVGQELDSEADVHRVLSAALAEEVTRPLRQLLDTQHKVRKGVEGMVDKTTRNVHEWRTAEYKAKKQSHSACRENEKIQDMALEARLGRGKTLSEKETIKMEKQRRKAEELVQRSEAEYYTCAVRAERARLEWESAIYKGTTCFQTLEEERLGALKQLVEKYQQNIKIAAPKMAESASRLEEPVSQCDVEKDVATIINAKGTGENIPHQLLPDFYAEDINNIMNRERRRESLEKLSKSFKSDIERERRGKQGVENLAKALQETPNFGGEDSQQDVSDKLQHMRAMLAYLEAARHKVQCSLAELEHRPRPSHPVERHVHTSRDKQGMMVSVLKVPAWLTPDSASPDRSPESNSPADSPDWRDRGAGDGTSVQPDSDFGRAHTEALKSLPLRTAISDALKLAEDLQSRDQSGEPEASAGAEGQPSSDSTARSAAAAQLEVAQTTAIGDVPDVVPKAAVRKSKLAKLPVVTNVVYVSVGNTPEALSRHNAIVSRERTLKSTQITSVTSSVPTALPSPSSRSGTLTSNKSLSNSSGPDSGPSSLQPSSCADTNTRAPVGMMLREFLPRIRYPSLPIIPPDEFSSQGSDREYQNAITSIGADVARNNIVNQQSNLTDHDRVTNYDDHTTTAPQAAAAEAEAATTRAAEAQQTSEEQNPIAAIGFYATQPPPNDAVEAMGRCKALYDYDANMYDELTIRTGDIIQLHRKQPDGWWVGELDGQVGIFPATYVEEID